MQEQNLNLSSFAIIILFITSFAYSSEINIVKGKAVIIDGDTIKINDQIIILENTDVVTEWTDSPCDFVSRVLNPFQVALRGTCEC